MKKQTANTRSLFKLSLYLLTAAAFVVTFFPAMIELVEKWSKSEDYTHAFFTVPIIAYIFWIERPNLQKTSGNTALSLPLVAGSLIFYLLALQMQIPTAIFLALALTIVSIIIYIYGVRSLRHMTIPLVLLLFILPIPNQILSTVTASLQMNVSKASEVIIQLFNIPLFREGNVLHIPEKTFQVVEACSGIRSLISLTTLSLIFSYFAQNRLWATAALFLFSVPVAIFINIIRIVSLVVLYHFYHIDLSVGTAHTLTGLILFLGGLILINLFQKMLSSWQK